jgi:DNA-binding transcriptional LysR family regulator
VVIDGVLDTDWLLGAREIAIFVYPQKRFILMYMIGSDDRIGRMDAGDLKVFAAVARLGGMNRAAVELHTVQSNVTARVQALEADIGCVLFERHRRGVSLTAAGQRLLPYAERVARLLADARRAARDDGAPRGQLTLGSLETTAALRLSPVLSRYVATYPEVDLVLRTGTTCELVEAVLAQQMEGAFVCGPVAHPALQETAMFVEELVVLAAPGVRSLDALLSPGDGRIVVLRAGCSYRQRLEALLARRGVPVPRRLEFGTLEAIFGCVSAGLGITLLPRALVGDVLAAGRVSVHSLPRADAVVETVFIRRREAFVSSAMQAFLAGAEVGLSAAA